MTVDKGFRHLRFSGLKTFGALGFGMQCSLLQVSDSATTVGFGGDVMKPDGLDWEMSTDVSCIVTKGSCPKP